MKRIILVLLVAAVAALAAGTPAAAEIMIFNDEASYLDALNTLGYTPLVEDFEGAAWDTVRAPDSAPSVTSVGITWTGNGPITTNLNWGRSGYGIFTTGGISREFFSDTSEQVLFGIAGWVDANPSQADLVILIRDRVVADPSVLGSGHHFFGVIETLGFTSFEIQDVSGPDQFPAIGADDFTFAVGGAFDDCNSNGIPDADDIFSGASPDCNANGIPDECDLLAGSEDCNENGNPDECDVVDPVIHASGDLSPIGAGFPQSFTILSPPETRADVRLAFIAAANLDGEENRIEVDINGTPVGPVFTGGRDCPWLFVDADELVVPKDTFNAIVSGGDATINMVTTSGVDPFNCEFRTSYVSVDVTLFISSDADQNGNGIPDECEGTGVAANGPRLVPQMLRNAPNPFYPETRIDFALPVAGDVVLAVYDAQGRRLAELANRRLPSGVHSFVWDGRDGLGEAVPAGVYLCRLTAGGQSMSRKMIVTK